MEIQSEDMEILLHTLGLTASRKIYRNHFVACPGHHDMPKIERLVAAGLMAQGQSPDFARPDATVFYVTDAGIVKSLREAAKRRKQTKLTRSQRTYREYHRNAECFDSFGDFLGRYRLDFEYDRAGLVRCSSFRSWSTGLTQGAWCRTKKEAKASYKEALKRKLEARHE